jgi:cobalt/nickel transport system permease protein
VVEKFATEGGREPWKPFIDTDQGDLLLFVFLLAGIVGGFVLGYNYCKLFSQRKEDEE